MRRKIFSACEMILGFKRERNTFGSVWFSGKVRSDLGLGLSSSSLVAKKKQEVLFWIFVFFIFIQ